MFGEQNVDPLVNENQPNQLQQQLLQQPNEQQLPVQQPNQNPVQQPNQQQIHLQPQIVQQLIQPQVPVQQPNQQQIQQQPQVVQQPIQPQNIQQQPSQHQPSQLQVDNNNQVGNYVQALATLPKTLEIDKTHKLVCKQCFKGFRDQRDLERHNNNNKCIDVPCKPREKSKGKKHAECDLINDTVMTEEDAMAIIHAKYAEKGFFRYIAKSDEFGCAVKNCESAVRKRKTTRYLQGRDGLQTVFVILGCKKHGHSDHEKLLGYCTINKEGHKHLIYERTFLNANDALAAIKANVYTEFKTKTDERRKTIHVFCTVTKNCGSELRLQYPDGKENETQVKGCVTHNHLPDTEVKIKCSGDHEDHIVMAYQCNSLIEVDDFIHSHELEAEFSISHSYYSDTKFYRRYACGCAGYYEAKTSTKKNINCSAGFVVRGNVNKDGSSMVTIIGCIRHENHEEGDIMEDRFKRISMKTKEVICGKLLLGIPPKEVARQMALDVDDKVDRDVLLEDVRRLAKQVIPKTATMHLKEPDAMLAILKKPAIRIFNFNEFIENLPDQLSDAEREKYIQTPDGRFLLMYMSDRMIQLFNEFPYNLEVDGTHSLNR